MRALIVKTSSLGDIVHALPALTDAVRAVPQLRCDWLAERAFAEIPGWHPAVGRVVACDLRGWRRNLRQTVFGGDWARFKAQLREHRYDLIIDAQGLFKSAWLASRAYGPLAGPDFESAREPLATLFYRHRYRIPKHNAAHAVERTRRLFAQAFGYALPEAPPDGGLTRERFPRPGFMGPYVVFVHGTTWPTKRWPIVSWQVLGAHLQERGVTPVLPWGSDAERADAEAIASVCGGLVLPRLGLTALAGWIAWARACVGVDTGLAHIAAALGTPQVTLYGPTLPQLTGAVGANQVWLGSDGATTIDRTRPNTVAIGLVQKAVDSLPELSVGGG